MNDELIGVEGLMAEDGYINFYSLLRVERTAAPEEIIENIIRKLRPTAITVFRRGDVSMGF
jgi:hypothetical protein